MFNEVASSRHAGLAMTVDCPRFVQLTSGNHITCRVIAIPRSGSGNLIFPFTGLAKGHCDPAKRERQSQTPMLTQSFSISKCGMFLLKPNNVYLLNLALQHGT
jgi:hypothetical protein